MNARVFQVLGLVVALVAALALVAACGSSQDSGRSQDAVAGERPETIRFAVTDLPGLQELQREAGPLRDTLSDVLGAEVEFFAVPNISAAAAAVEADRVDLVLTGPSEYVLISSSTDAVPMIGVSRPQYYTVIATHAGSGIDSLEDLKGKEIATWSPGGTTTELGTCMILQEAGMNCREDVGVRMLGEFEPVVQALMREEVPAVGLPYLDRYKAQLVGRDDVSQEDVPIVAKGRQMPPDVFMANPDTLSQEYIGQIREQMLRQEDDILTSIRQSPGKYGTNYENSSFVEVNDSDYDYVRKAFEAADYGNLQETLEQQ